MQNLFKALQKVQAEIKPLVKDQKGQEGHRTFMYADLTQLLAQAVPLLTKNGLVLIQELECEADAQFLKTTLAHAESGETYTAKCPVFFAQNTPRAVGSAMTYARRYSLLGLLALSPGDDDDGEAAQAPRPQAQSARSQAQSAPPKPAMQATRPPQAPQQAGRPQATQQAKAIPNHAPNMIKKGLTQLQIDRIYAIGARKRWEPEEVDGLIGELFGLDSPKDLSLEQFAELCDFLDSNGPEAKAMTKGLRE